MARGVEAIIQPNVQFLHASRPLSVSITNALKFIKWQIANLDTDDSDVEQKQTLLDSIDTYIRDQLEKAAQAISISVQQKISNNDVILTFGCSSLITHILEEAKKRNVDFRVIVVDARPDHEGQEMLRRLVSQNIRCTIVMINAIGFIMPEVIITFILRFAYNNYASEIFVHIGNQSAAWGACFNGQRICHVAGWNRTGRPCGKSVQRSRSSVLRNAQI